MNGRRYPGGGQAGHAGTRHAGTRHADDWLMTYADTITLLLCLFAVLLALHGAKLHGAANVPVPVPASAGASRSSTSLQAGIGIAPFRELAGMPRPLEDADDDPDDRTTRPNNPPTRQMLPATGRSSAEPAAVGSFMTAAFDRPEPVPIARPVPDTAAAAPAVPASPASAAQRTADAGRAATPPPEAATPVNARPAAVPEEPGDRITLFQFSSATFFASGAAILTDSGQSILGSLLGRLQSPEFAAYRITVEGHTDDEPIGSTQFPSNWELSAARAAAVVRFLVDHGVSANRLRAAGYADTRPLAPNRDAAGNPIPANQAMNRRVVIELEKIDHRGTDAGART